MSCTPSNHVGDVLTDARGFYCAACGHRISITAGGLDESDPIARLCDAVFAEHKQVALVVQFYAGQWQAGTRNAQGIGPIAKASTPTEAITKLVELLEWNRP